VLATAPRFCISVLLCCRLLNLRGDIGIARALTLLPHHCSLNACRDYLTVQVTSTCCSMRCSARPDCITDNLGVSSMHVTFNTEEESTALTSVGFLQRTGIQYHW